MEVTLYADVLFFVNFSMDFISVWAASRLASGRGNLLRMCLAAAVGAVYGVFAVILGFSGAVSYISAAAVSILMSLAAFGFSGSILATLRQSVVIWAAGALLGGIMTFVMSRMNSTATESSPVPFSAAVGASFAALYLIVRIVKRTVFVKTVKISVFVGKKSVSFDALCDSGNLLCDPISGTPVITVSEKTVAPVIIDFSTVLAGDFSDFSGVSHNIRFIPHKTATGSSVAAAFLPDRVTITVKNKKRDVKCLIMPAKLSDDYFGGYPATVPSSVIGFI